METASEGRQAEELAAERAALVAAEEQRRQERDRWSDDAIDRTPLLGRRGLRRLGWLAVAAILLVLLVTVPPLVNVNRYQHRIASAITGSIGRPVRFDSIELHLLPLPGFTIHNFVVMEDGAFGAEPSMRANVVEVRVRAASLWRRRVEISHIRLESPTVNLVRNQAGYWNLQGVVSQAAQVQSAPTAQPTAGSAPRFPYIEATDARVNIKFGDTKQPFALTDAAFALWLPNQQQWHVRLAGKPMRTDTDVSDIGELRVEATLGRGNGSAAEQPLALDAAWKPTPLGEGSKLALGNDAGWRGSISAEAHVHGTPSAMHLVTDVHLRSLRRAEFVPAEALDLDAHCVALATGALSQFHGVRCALPTANHTSLLDELPFFKTAATTTTAPDVLTLEAEVPGVTDWRSAAARVNLQAASPEWALRWMRLFSTRMTPAEQVGGSFSLSATLDPTVAPGRWSGTAVCHCVLPTTTGGSGKDGVPWLVRATGDADATAGSPATLAVTASEEQIPAPSQPDAETPHTGESAAGTVSTAGTTFHYSSLPAVLQLARVLPTLADNLPATATPGPMTATRTWGQSQVWTAIPAVVPTTPRARLHRGRSARR